MTNAIRDLVAKRTALMDEAKGIENDVTKTDRLVEISNEVSKLDDQISALEALEALEAKNASANGTPVSEPKNNRPFKSFGEQLKAIKNAASGIVDERLKTLNAAAGMNEGVGADGGYLVQDDFAAAILEGLEQESPILTRVSTFEVSERSNGVKIPVDKKSTNGIQAYWVPEAGQIPDSKPDLAMVNIPLNKLAGLTYVTDELLEDAPFLAGFLTRKFRATIAKMQAGAVIDGDGVDKFKGILESGALVTIAKESGQVADTVNAQNLAKMYAALKQEYRANAVWLIHPDVAAQLPFMYAATGSYSGQLVYMPAGGISGVPYATLFGLPIIEDENCSALGDKGDVILADLSRYMLIRKGGAKTATSIHVKFDTAQTAFRVIYRCGGAPLTNWTEAVKNSTIARSPFITLAARA